MEFLAQLQLGLQTALTAQNLLFVGLGAALGTLVGVLRGVGPAAVIALLLPCVYWFDAMPVIIMLAALYYGSQYGTSTAAMLAARRGEALPVLAGAQDAQKTGSALAIAAFGSFVAGCVTAFLIAMLVPTLANWGLTLGSQDYFSLMVLALAGAVVLASGSLVKAIAMVVLGLLLGQANSESGVALNLHPMDKGLAFVVFAMGVFGFSEFIAKVANLPTGSGADAVPVVRLRDMVLARVQVREGAPAVARGTALGTLMGMLPGGGAALASFAANTLERFVAKDRVAAVGQGAVAGIAGPESARNAGAQASFIPMLGLGIAPNAVLALMVGAMSMKGMQSGPQWLSTNASLFWGLVASMWVGNVLLLALNLPFVHLWIQLLRVPNRILFPAILVLCCFACFSLAGSDVALYWVAAFSLLGYALHKLSCEPAPLLLGFMLGPQMQAHLHEALVSTQGDLSSFVTQPLSAAFLIGALILILSVVLPSVRKGRKQAFVQG